MLRSSILVVLLALAACSSPRSVSTAVRGSLGDGIEFFLEDGGGVALMDGEVRGAEAFDEFRWGPRSSAPQVHDHPRLAAIRAAVQRLSAPDRSGAALEAMLVDAAEVPFDRFLGRTFATWVGDDPERAAALLDQGDRFDLGEAAAALTTRALRARDTSDARIAQWVGIESVRSEAGALRTLMQAPSMGWQTRTRLLRYLDDINSDQRAEFLIELGAPLLGEPAAADALAASLQELYGDERARVGQTWAQSETCSPTLAFALLGELDDLSPDGRARVLEALTPRLATRSGGPNALARRIEDLYGDARTEAALRLATYPDNSFEVSAALLPYVDELYGQDRVRLLEALIDGPGFTGPNQRACIRAADEELAGSTRRAVLQRIVASARTEPAHRRAAEILLAR